MQLAEFIARSLRGARMCILGSHRDLEARRAPEIDAALARLARAGEHFLLPRLGVDEVASLVEAETGRGDAGTARMIHDATEGNPLFVRELLRLIAARGAAGGGGVPAGVRAVQAAAVVGREFSLRLAAEVAGVTPSALDVTKLTTGPFAARVSWVACAIAAACACSRSASHDRVLSFTCSSCDGKARDEMLDDLATKHYKGIYRQMFQGATPSAIVSKLASIWSRYYDKGEAMTEFVGATRALSKIVNCPELPRGHELLLIPYMKTVLTLSGVREVNIKHTRCVAEGSDHCLLEYTWK